MTPEANLTHPLLSRLVLALVVIALLSALTPARTGDVPFGAAHEVLGQTGATSDLALADFDADGDLDLVATSDDAGRVTWFRNVDGQGQLIEDAVLTEELPIYSGHAVAVADIDGDSDPDVLSSMTTQYAWYSNRKLSSGVFGDKVPIEPYVGFHCFAMAPADLDGDGDIDLAYGTTVEVGWYENLDGTGRFGPAHVLVEQVYYNRSVVAADLDSDGDLDLAVASFNDDNVTWFENDGRGRFAAPRLVTSDAQGARCVVATDLDGDLDLDLICAEALGDRVTWLENRAASAHFAPPQVIGEGLDGATCVVASDLDADGNLDVLVASADDDRVSWYQNLGVHGAFGERRVLIEGVLGACVVRTGDLDGDGDLDVVLAGRLDDRILWIENLLLPATP